MEGEIEGEHLAPLLRTTPSGGQGNRDEGKKTTEWEVGRWGSWRNLKDEN